MPFLKVKQKSDYRVLPPLQTNISVNGLSNHALYDDNYRNPFH